MSTTTRVTEKHFTQTNLLNEKAWTKHPKYNNQGL